MKAFLFLLILLSTAYAADKPYSEITTSHTQQVHQASSAELLPELWGIIVDSLDISILGKLSLTGKKTLPKKLTNAPIHLDFQKTVSNYTSVKLFKWMTLQFPQARSIKVVLVSSLDSNNYFSYLPSSLDSNNYFSYLPSSLKSLHLVKVTSAYTESIEDAAELPRGLTSLSLQCKMGNLKELPPSLTNLNFSFFESYTNDAVLDWSGKLDLSYLQLFSNLTSFTLDHDKCAVTNLDSLPTSLRQLHLPVKCTPTVTDESFSALQKLTNLTELRLNQIVETSSHSQVEFTEDLLDYLPQNLTSLNLENFSKITSDKLTALKKFPLHSLSITLGIFQINELAANLPITVTALSINMIRSKQIISLNQDTINTLARLTSLVDLRLPFISWSEGQLTADKNPHPWTLANLKKYVPS